MSKTSHIFISYSRKNEDIASRLRKDLQSTGLSIWFDRDGLQVGTPSWDQALRDAIDASRAVILIASPDSRRSAYVGGEIAVALSAKKPIYPVWVEGTDWNDCVPLGIITTQNIDLRGENYTNNLARLIGSLTGTAGDSEAAPIIEFPKPLPAPIEPRNPYKGLRAFRAEDQSDFFGRNALIEALLESVKKSAHSSRFLAVLGASGSGKSSVMMAGLLPRLKAEHPDWIFLDPIVPGSHPIENLTISLARAFKSRGQEAIRNDLMDRRTRGLHGLALELSDKPVVLYIDQFEEVFTLVSSESERRQFLDLLSTASTEDKGRLYVLLSMRADFYDRPLQYNLFADLLAKHHIPITPMTLADLYDVVQRPATQADVALTFEEGLVTEIVFVVRGEAANLPLLQFTLDQLFQQREGQNLTLKAYEAIGGVQGALTRHAEATYENLASNEHKKLARALFMRLIEVGQTEQDTTRRRASYSELTLPDIQQTRILREVADKFVEARLLVSDRQVSTKHETELAEQTSLEVGHEALIREWRQLGEWIRNARDDLRLQNSLSVQVSEWSRRKEPQDMLYRGTVLTEALAWAERNIASRDETRFLSASQAAEKERQEQEESAARRLRYLAVGLVAVIVIASLVTAWIFARDNADLLAEAETAEGQIALAYTEQAAAQATAADAQEQALTAEFQGAYFQSQVEYAATRQFGISPLDITLTPALDFLSTATAYAAFDWTPVSESIAGVEMVLVPAGCFYMGSSELIDELPIHEICFENPFWIDKYEVSNAQFNEFNGAAVDKPLWTDEDMPRTSVTWYEARDFCELRGAQLPSEAEWEYAARGPNSLVYPWGNEFIANNVVYFENATQPEPVDTRASGVSWVGAHHMSGNVWEWLSTIYDQDRFPYPYVADDGREAREAPAGVLRTLRSGSFNFNTAGIRAGDRNKGDPLGENSIFGFRCVRSDE